FEIDIGAFVLGADLVIDVWKEKRFFVECFDEIDGFEYRLKDLLEGGWMVGMKEKVWWNFLFDLVWLNDVCVVVE
uniref:hypothetical protein n=1 Tax=Priestia megaterium TaxID=1404 RepID=UPI001C999AA3